MASQNTQYGDGTRVRDGAPVFGVDGVAVGSVAAVHPEYVVVAKGAVFPTDFFVPHSAIARVADDGGMHLNVTSEDALNQSRQNPPDRLVEGAGLGRGDESSGTTFEADPQGEVGGEVTTGGLGRFARAAEPAATAGLTGATDASASEATGEAMRIPLHEEQLVPVKREVQRGAVRIEKAIVVEDHTITVPVAEERLRITRLASTNGTGDHADAFAEEVIEIPLRGEEVEITKRPRVANEVLIEKETIQRTERLADTVRREEVGIDEDVVDG